MQEQSILMHGITRLEDSFHQDKWYFKRFRNSENATNILTKTIATSKLNHCLDLVSRLLVLREETNPNVGFFFNTWTFSKKMIIHPRRDCLWMNILQVGEIVGFNLYGGFFKRESDERCKANTERMIWFPKGWMLWSGHQK